MAKDLLKVQGFPAGDYHRSFDEWFASSPMVEIGDGTMPNNIACYIEGNDDAVTTLKLKLNVNEPDSAQSAEMRFTELGQVLIGAATGEAAPDFAAGDIDIPLGGYRIRVVKSPWPPGRPNRYDRILTAVVGPGS